MILLTGIRFTKIRGIALWPFVLVLPKKPDAVLLNHERIHLRQQAEMLVLFFYLWYMAEWLYYYLQLRDRWAAYYRISFEKEAYAHEKDQDYLQKRKFWSFLKYI